MLERELPIILSELATNTREKIKVFGASFNAEAFDQFINALASNKSLKKLKLCNCQLSESQVVSLCAALQNHPQLQELDLSNNPSLPGYNHIHHQGGNAIANFLTNNNTLVKLNLSHNELGHQSIDLIAQALLQNKRLKNLKLSGCGLDTITLDSCLANLIKLLESSTVLEKLDLSDNWIELSLIIKLFESLRSNGSLKAFLINYYSGFNIHEIPRELQEKVLDILRTNHTLTQIGLISDDQIQYLLQIPPGSSAFNTVQPIFNFLNAIGEFLSLNTQIQDLLNYLESNHAETKLRAFRAINNLVQQKNPKNNVSFANVASSNKAKGETVPSLVEITICRISQLLLDETLEINDQLFETLMKMSEALKGTAVPIILNKTFELLADRNLVFKDAWLNYKRKVVSIRSQSVPTLTLSAAAAATAASSLPTSPRAPLASPSMPMLSPTKFGYTFNLSRNHSGVFGSFGPYTGYAGQIDVSGQSQQHQNGENSGAASSAMAPAIIGPIMPPSPATLQTAAANADQHFSLFQRIPVSPPSSFVPPIMSPGGTSTTPKRTHSFDGRPKRRIVFNPATQSSTIVTRSPRSSQ